MIADLASYLGGGAVAGLIAGLFGVGGGTILVPVLLFIYSTHSLPEEHHMHLAVGTSLAVIVLNALSSMRAHHKQGSVDWRVFWRLTPGVVVGALVGAWLADRMASRTLVLIFAVFLILVAAQMLLGRQPRPGRTTPGAAGLGVTGGIIGTISALVGIGGGSMTVPYLMWCNVAASRAVGTAAAVGLPIALSGAAGFILAGWGNPQLPPWSLGYVYLPAFLGMAAAGMLCAPLGAKLANRMPARRLKQAFGVFVLLVAFKLLQGLIG